jgi:hypothetical protein
VHPYNFYSSKMRFYSSVWLQLLLLGSDLRDDSHTFPGVLLSLFRHRSDRGVFSGPFSVIGTTGAFYCQVESRHGTPESRLGLYVLFTSKCFPAKKEKTRTYDGLRLPRRDGDHGIRGCLSAVSRAGSSFGQGREHLNGEFIFFFPIQLLIVLILIQSLDDLDSRSFVLLDAKAFSESILY